MARHLGEIEALEQPEDAVLGREGMIWWPEGVGTGERVRQKSLALA